MRDGLSYEGNLDGLYLLKSGRRILRLLRVSRGVGGDLALGLTHLHLELDPLPEFFMAALWLWYGVTRPSTTMLNAIHLGWLRLSKTRGLLLRITYPGAGLRPLWRPPHLNMHPPQLVRHEVDDMRAKTVFQEKLDPIQRRRLGKVFEKLVPMHVRIRIWLRAPRIHGRLLHLLALLLPLRQKMMVPLFQLALMPFYPFREFL